MLKVTGANDLVIKSLHVQYVSNYKIFNKLITAHVLEESMSMVEINVDLESCLMTTPTNFIPNTSIADLHVHTGNVLNHRSTDGTTHYF